MTTEYSANFRIPIPDFLSEPWHALLQEAIRDLDNAVYEALLADNVAQWANSTAYVIGSIVTDPATGLLWTCGVAHTSSASPVTFTSFVTANPTYWTRSATIPQQRGAWTTATSYLVGDFVVDSSRYAVCIVAHTSGTFNTDLAAGKWVVLIDLSSIGIGINATTEDTIVAASTTDIGSKAASRIQVTGATAITSFGTVANAIKILRYASTPVITYSATHLILLGGANRTARAGDIQFLSSNSVGDWRELAYFRADGQPATDTERGFIELATTSEATTGTDTVRAVTPAGLKAAIDALLPSGTRLIFQQTTAPTGWTKDTTKNDNALRIVSGTASSGGTVDFSTLFGRTATDAKTLAQANLPNVNFTVSVGGAGGDPHKHTVPISSSGANVTAGAVNVMVPGGSTDTSNTTLGPLTAASGGTGTSFTVAIDMRVKYTDVIVAERN